MHLNYVSALFLYPPKTKFGNPSVRLYVCVIVSGPYLSYGELLEVLTSLKDYLWPGGGVSWLESMSFGQGHWQKRVQNRVRYISFLWRTRSSCFTQRLFMTWACVKSLKERSFGQEHGHWQENCEICVRFVSFYVETLDVLNSHRDCLFPEGVS